MRFRGNVAGAVLGSSRYGSAPVRGKSERPGVLQLSMIMHALSRVPFMIVDTYGHHSDGKGSQSYRARNVCPGDLVSCR